MAFLKWLNPVPGIRDFWREFARPHPYRLRAILMAAAMTTGIMTVMWQEEVIGEPEKPVIIWISTFAPGRTDAEIIATNIANQKRKDQLAAEQAAAEERVKAMYRALGRASGMDVDKIEREAAADEAAKGAAAQVPPAAPPPTAPQAGIGDAPPAQ